MVQRGSRGLLGGLRKSPKPRRMALGGFPGAFGAPGARTQKPKHPYFVQGLLSGPVRGVCSAELFRSLKVSDRRRHTPKSAQNRSESLCAGLWVPCRIFWAWFGLALGPNPNRNRGFPAGSLNVFGAFLAQPIWGRVGLGGRSPQGSSLSFVLLVPDVVFVDCSGGPQTL